MTTKPIASELVETGPAANRPDRGWTRAFVAIGSNIEPLKHIPACLDLLRSRPESRLAARSSWYRTRPWGIEAQPDFINLVVAVDVPESPDAAASARRLLRETQAIEEQLQRARARRNGPRTIDLDILLFGDTRIDGDELVIPHPALLLRDFMLIPLIEIAPNAVHPDRGLPVRDLVHEIRYRQIIDRLDATGSER